MVNREINSACRNSTSPRWYRSSSPASRHFQVQRQSLIHTPCLRPFSTPPALLPVFIFLPSLSQIQNMKNPKTFKCPNYQSLNQFTFASLYPGELTVSMQSLRGSFINIKSIDQYVHHRIMYLHISGNDSCFILLLRKEYSTTLIEY